uniref:NADH-ubiquinone oxidoreductase chain 2 n=6 Tax=Polytomella TaxID=3049 RepID=Q8LYW0_9CHLO|nr:NADH dehydrogenase subuint 2 [Polytomella parva]AAL65274.1 NADH dehydrogenase subuint 2 [Polytomella parva]7AR9_N Chain N, ND2 [Polytomella sp. Pringsheim 198.80]7ARD_N Chain N, ND2 [Polytomella sp. Pringsheim 198.80]
MWENLWYLDILINVLIITIFGLISCSSSATKSYDLKGCFIISMVGGVYDIPSAILWCLASLSILNFNGFFASLFLVFTWISNLFAMQSLNFLGIYLAFEMQSLCLLVLGKITANENQRWFAYRGLLKYLVLSLIAGSIFIFHASSSYLQSGVMISDSLVTYVFLLFKLGVAPFHMYTLELFSVVSRHVAFVFSTLPKLSVLYLISNSNIGSECVWWGLISLWLGSISQYQSVFVRSILLYSSVAEIGLVLLVLQEGFSWEAFSWVSIYFLSLSGVWHANSKFVSAISVASIAGLPPFLGFIGKAQILKSLVSINLGILIFSSILAATISFIGYLRLIRLMYLVSPVKWKNNKDSSFINWSTWMLTVGTLPMVYSV